MINGLGYGVTQDGQFPNYDGTYNITFNFTETFICPGLPICAPPISGGGTFAATFKNGVLVGGAIDGTISDFGELVITASAGGATISLSGSIDETGNGTGLVSGGGPFFVIGGSWSATKQ